MFRTEPISFTWDPILIIWKQKQDQLEYGDWPDFVLLKVVATCAPRRMPLCGSPRVSDFQATGAELEGT